MADKRLAAAHAAFLIAPASGSAPGCLQAALLTLLGRGFIAFEEKTSRFGEPQLLLRDGDGEPLAPHLAVVRDALESHKPGRPRLSRNEVVHALQKRFGLGFRRYVGQHLAPSLAARGLIVESRRKWLGLFPYTHYERTAAGDALAAPLLRLMRAADDLPALIEADPDRALHLIRSAGVLLVMSPKARRQIPRLRKLLETRGEDSPSLTFVYVADEPEAEWEQILDLGDIMLSEEGLDLFDSIDIVGDFTAGGDGGSSDGGDGGGGGD